MVAYTSPDCLPFFECDDSPCENTGTLCEPSTVWCDLVNLIDPILTGFDNALNRTAVTVPFFKVALTVPRTTFMTSTTYDNLPFDIVYADNEDMVNLDVDPFAGYISRPGIWQFDLYGFANLGTVGNNALWQLALSDGGQTNTPIDRSQSMWRTDDSVHSRLSWTQVITAAQVATSPFRVGAASSVLILFNADITVQSVEFAAQWVGDQP